MRQTILEEYEKCKNHYQSLRLMEPEAKSATQIERDLGRTFPLNPYFQQ